MSKHAKSKHALGKSSPSEQRRLEKLMYLGNAIPGVYFRAVRLSWKREFSGKICQRGEREGGAVHDNERALEIRGRRMRGGGR